MIHKRIKFSISANETIDLQFDVDHSGPEMAVKNIHIHGSSETELPHTPEIKFNDKAKEWQFYITWQKEENGIMETVNEYFVSEAASAIIKEMMRIAEEREAEL